MGFTTCTSYPYSVALSEYNMKQMLMQRAACPWLYVREKIVFNGWMFYSYIGFVARSAIERRRRHAKDAVVVIIELLLPCHSWIELAPIDGASSACRNAPASSPPPIPPRAFELCGSHRTSRLTVARSRRCASVRGGGRVRAL